MPDAVTCPNCQGEVPPGRHCVRCGQSLEGPAKTKLRRHGPFAAAPHEHRLMPWPASTLFPHLTRASMRDFHLALLVGVAIVVVLGLLSLFGVALVVAALLVPVLAGLYLYEVDVYEREPLPVLALTAVWGGVSGIGVAILAHVLAPSTAAAVQDSTASQLLIGAVLLPLLGL